MSPPPELTAAGQLPETAMPVPPSGYGRSPVSPDRSAVGRPGASLRASVGRRLGRGLGPVSRLVPALAVIVAVAVPAVAVALALANAPAAPASSSGAPFAMAAPVAALIVVVIAWFEEFPDGSRS